jgi:hypothetical protein
LLGLEKGIIVAIRFLPSFFFTLFLALEVQRCVAAGGCYSTFAVDSFPRPHSSFAVAVHMKKPGAETPGYPVMQEFYED